MTLSSESCTTAADGDLISFVAGLLSQHGVHVSVKEVAVSNRSGYQLVRSRPEVAILITAYDRDETRDVCEQEDDEDDLSTKTIAPQILKVQRLPHVRERRNEAAESTRKRIEVAPLVIDQSRRVCALGGQEVDLTTAEFELLWLLAIHAGSVVSRHRLYQELLGLKYDGLDRSIDLRVSRLRRKLKDDQNRAELIKSIHGVGYLLAAPDQNGNSHEFRPHENHRNS
ncbi:MAG: response regulator transcription factor [Planctomycetes bacterium]|nr:response regulator transcription factor [Planctomycetota bacterium]